MADQTKTYEGVPAGAVFEAAQKSLRSLNYAIKKEDHSTLSITAKAGMTMKSFGQQILLSVVEVGSATELAIKTSSGQVSDWGEGKTIINAILSNIDTEISKIRSEGRISPVRPAVYSMGAVSHQKSEVETNPTSKKENTSGGSWPFRVVAVVAALWLINTEAGSKFLSSIFGSFGVETDISKYDCQKVASLFKGESLQNAFGGSFKIIQVTSVKEISKTSTMIVCTGEMGLSNGTSQMMRMRVEKGEDTSEILYRAEPL